MEVVYCQERLQSLSMNLLLKFLFGIYQLHKTAQCSYAELRTWIDSACSN